MFKWKLSCVTLCPAQKRKNSPKSRFFNLHQIESYYIKLKPKTKPKNEKNEGFIYRKKKIYIVRYQRKTGLSYVIYDHTSQTSFSIILLNSLERFLMKNVYFVNVLQIFKEWLEKIDCFHLYSYSY